MKSTWYKVYNYGKTKNYLLQRSETTMVKLDMINKQATVNTCQYMNSRNDWWMMRFKAIEEEYYVMEN